MTDCWHINYNDLDWLFEWLGHRLSGLLPGAECVLWVRGALCSPGVSVHSSAWALAQQRVHRGQKQCWQWPMSIFSKTLLYLLLHFILLRWARQVPIFTLRKPRSRFHSKLVAMAHLEPSSPDSLSCAHLGNGGMNASLPSGKITQQPGISSFCAVHTHSGSFSDVDAVFAQPAEAGLRRDMPGPASSSLPRCCWTRREKPWRNPAGWSAAPVASVTPRITPWRRWVCRVRLWTLLSS